MKLSRRVRELVSVLTIALWTKLSLSWKFWRSRGNLQIAPKLTSSTIKKAYDQVSWDELFKCFFKNAALLATCYQSSGLRILLGRLRFIPCEQHSKPFATGLWFCQGRVLSPLFSTICLIWTSSHNGVVRVRKSADQPYIRMALMCDESYNR